MTIQTFAPAKVNLCLHVGPTGTDGYHPVASLAVFADVGDTVTARPAERLSLEVAGPFASGLAGEADNLVLRALRALGARAGIGEPGLAVTLDKRLPIASGLGGGSSDAGAALRAGREALGLDLSDADLTAIAADLGADGPLCLWVRPAIAEGRGDVLTPAPSLPPISMLLVNPGVPSPTGAVYRAYDDGPAREAILPPRPAAFADLSALVDWLNETRNDLQPPAIALTPAIGDCLAVLDLLDGVRFVRMSGSGGTCFALFDDDSAAQAAALTLSTLRPDWWVVAARCA